MDKIFISFIILYIFIYYFIILYDDNNQSIITTIINILFNKNHNNHILNIDSIDNSNELEERRKLDELFKQSNLFKYYPSKKQEIIDRFEEKQLIKKKRIEELNQTNQLYSDLERQINYSTLFVISFTFIPIILFIINKLIKTYSKSYKSIKEQINETDNEINQIINNQPLIELNRIKSTDTDNILLLEKLLNQLKDRHLDNCGSDDNNNVLLKYEEEIGNISNIINSKKMNETKLFNQLSTFYNNNQLLLSDSKNENEFSDIDYILSITNIDSNKNDSTSGISKTDELNNIGPINEEINNNNNSYTISPSNLELSINNSNNNHNNNNNHNHNNNNNNNFKNNYNKKKDVKYNDNYDKSRRTSLELQNGILLIDYKRFLKKKDAAEEEFKQIQKEIQKEKEIQRHQQEEKERIKKEKQDELEETKSNKFFSGIIKLMLILNILPELLKLIKHHLNSLLPTILCLNLKDIFNTSIKELTNQNNNSFFNPKYYLKLFLNQISFNTPKLTTTTTNPSINSLNININNIFNCIPASFEINWRLWIYTIIYIILIVISLQFQINSFIIAIIFLTISISTYKINYNDINYYFLHIILNLLIIYSVKRYNYKIKQSNHSTTIRILIVITLIGYNYLVSNYYLDSKKLLIVQ